MALNLLVWTFARQDRLESDLRHTRLIRIIGNNFMNIAAAGNTEIPGILVLEFRGYHISTLGDESWHAVRNHCKYTVENPLELLGLVELHVARGADWKATDHDVVRCTDKYNGLRGN